MHNKYNLHTFLKVATGTPLASRVSALHFQNKPPPCTSLPILPVPLQQRPPPPHCWQRISKGVLMIPFLHRSPHASLFCRPGNKEYPPDDSATHLDTHPARPFPSSSCVFFIVWRKRGCQADAKVGRRAPARQPLAEERVIIAGDGREGRSEGSCHGGEVRRRNALSSLSRRLLSGRLPLVSRRLCHAGDKTAFFFLSLSPALFLSSPREMKLRKCFSHLMGFKRGPRALCAHRLFLWVSFKKKKKHKKRKRTQNVDHLCRVDISKVLFTTQLRTEEARTTNAGGK